MDIVSQINEKTRCPSAIEVSPYLRDHHSEGKVILPAVEILIALAHVVKLNLPQMSLNCLLKASFPRFLFIAPETQRLAVLVDIENVGNDNIAAVLLTSIKSKKTLFAASSNMPVWNLQRTIPLPALQLLFGLSRSWKENASASLQQPFIVT
jgi:hypothetical protein